MVGRRKGDPVPHMIHASGCSDRQDVRRVHQTKLNARHGAAVAVGEKNLLAETGQAGKAAHLLDDAPAWRRQNVDLLGRRLLETGNLVEQPQNVCVPPVAVKKSGVHAVGHEHIRTYAHRNFVVILPVKAQAVRFRAGDLSPVDLDRRRACCERPVSGQVEATRANQAFARRQFSPSKLNSPSRLRACCALRT